MEALGSLVGSGRVVDLILGLVAAEAALVALGIVRFGPRAPLLAGLAAGAGLLLALRAGLAGAPWPWIAGALGLAGGAHLTELVLRARKTLRRREPSATSGDAAALGSVSHRHAFMPRPGQPPRPPAAAEEGSRAGAGSLRGPPSPAAAGGSARRLVAPTA